VAKIAQGLKGKVLRKRFVLPIESWFFTFFHFFFALHDVTFNVTAMIWMWSCWFFSRNFTKSIVLKFWVKTPINKKNSSSLILTNLELGFEPCVLNLIRKWVVKDPQKRKDHLIFINFRVKKFTIKKQPKKTKLWCLNIIISYIPRNEELQFFEVISNKVTSRSYSYFLKISYFYFLKTLFFQLCQKLQSLVKLTQGILGVKLEWPI
jgi:hypothetical protein